MDHREIRRKMKKLAALLAILGLLGLMTACTNTPGKQSIIPAKGKPTFVFFYTDN